MKHIALASKVIIVIVLVLPAVAGCKLCEGGACANATGETGKAISSQTMPAVITTEALKTMLDSGTPLVLLDARSGKYDDGKRIPGAKSLNEASSKQDIANVVPKKDSLIVTYCASLTCPASNKLAEHLKKLGYRNVLEYSEGIAGWQDAGNKVTETVK